jgi:hypothetical protein
MAGKAQLREFPVRLVADPEGAGLPGGDLGPGSAYPSAEDSLAPPPAGPSLLSAAKVPAAAAAAPPPTPSASSSMAPSSTPVPLERVEDIVADTKRAMAALAAQQTLAARAARPKTYTIDGGVVRPGLLEHIMCVHAS